MATGILQNFDCGSCSLNRCSVTLKLHVMQFKFIPSTTETVVDHGFVGLSIHSNRWALSGPEKGSENKSCVKATHTITLSWCNCSSWVTCGFSVPY